MNEVEIELPDPQNENIPPHILSPPNTQLAPQRLSPQKEKTPTAPNLLSASSVNTQPAPQTPTIHNEKSPIKRRRSSALHSKNKKVSKVDTTYIDIY